MGDDESWGNGGFDDDGWFSAPPPKPRPPSAPDDAAVPVGEHSPGHAGAPDAYADLFDAARRAWDQFLTSCGRLHERQYRWSPKRRRLYWIGLLPVAGWCWAAGLQAGWIRRVALGSVAGLTLLLVQNAGGSGSSGAVRTNAGAALVVTTSTSTSASTTSLSTTTTSSSTTTTTSSSTTTASSTTSTTDLSVSTLRPASTEATSTTAAPTTAAPATSAKAAPPPPPSTAAPAPQALAGAASGCDPNYDGCVPVASDVDCAGGSGNGPAYVAGPVRVIGTDIYGLDADNDGIGCE